MKDCNFTWGYKVRQEKAEDESKSQETKAAGSPEKKKEAPNAAKGMDKFKV